MEPLAPLVDQLCVLARAELPAPRTCRVRTWDDGTFDVHVYHSMADDEVQIVRYERRTSEILLERRRGSRWRSETLTGGETVFEPTADEVDVRVLATVEPPYA